MIGLLNVEGVCSNDRAVWQRFFLFRGGGRDATTSRDDGKTNISIHILCCTMAGLVVTWDGSELQAIDEGNFESVVVEVVEHFFATVEGYRSVTAEWKAGEWDYGSEYEILEPPTKLINGEGYFIHIKGKSRGGEYEIEMNPSGMFVETLSTGQTKELDYLTLRAPGVAVNNRDEELFVESIPERIRKRVVESLPTIEI